MIRVVVAVDEQNASHGSYFDASKDYLAGLIDELEGDFHVMNSSSCKKSYVNDSLPAVCGDKPFVFTVFSHGNEKACVAGGQNYVDEQNLDKFKNTLFYSTACLNGKELGQKLIESGCTAFVGFTAESNALSVDDHSEIFMRCDLACLFSFLGNEGKTLKEAMADSEAYYNREIDKLDSFWDVVAKGLLIENRDTLKVFGNTDLKREDLSF